jgi:hypothetical protein
VSTALRPAASDPGTAEARPPRPPAPFGAPTHHLEREAVGGIGLPQDRRARIAARRAFVNLKQTYLLALQVLPGSRGDWLRHQVHRAEDPIDLWLLRGLVFDAMPGGAGRAALQRELHTLFPPRSPQSGFTPLF